MGFNPCCRGTAWSTPISHGRDPAGPLEFQSLLSWNGLVNASGSRSAGTVIGVSILVVVERPGQRGARAASRQALQVSILVVVERPGQPWTARSSARRCVPSFNPCCRGTAWSTRWPRRLADADESVSILVVVERPGQQPIRAGAAPMGRTCFNPCCRGTAWSTRPWHERRNGGEGFQSLLSWNGLVNCTWVPTGPSAGPVSILVVVERPGQRRGRVVRAVRRHGFNPCCRGTAWSTAT